MPYANGPDRLGASSAGGVVVLGPADRFQEGESAEPESARLRCHGAANVCVCVSQFTSGPAVVENGGR